MGSRLDSDVLVEENPFPIEIHENMLNGVPPTVLHMYWQEYSTLLLAGNYVRQAIVWHP